ncbi:hypothetical protein K4F52_003603 [Lecanicillium sp. MT-2017a]|nr:hypothetical protein K4F52_003603 [Lecanicillium sp. MT-2017a]
MAASVNTEPPKQEQEVAAATEQLDAKDPKAESITKPTDDATTDPDNATVTKEPDTPPEKKLEEKTEKKEKKLGKKKEEQNPDKTVAKKDDKKLEKKPRAKSNAKPTRTLEKKDDKNPEKEGETTLEKKDEAKPAKKAAVSLVKPKAKRGPYKPRAKKAAAQTLPKPTTEAETDKKETPPPPPKPPTQAEKEAAPPPAPPPPLEKAISFFPVLPQESNPIDEVILQRLAECWDEEASRWTLEMRESFIDNIPRARVTRATAQFANHSLSKAVRLSNEIPTWGQWMILRIMFGPGMCSRQKWFKAFAAAFPLAREPAYDGVVPVNAVDVLDGVAMMPLQRKRKSASVWQLEPQRSRNRVPKDVTALIYGSGGALGLTKRVRSVLATDGVSDGGGVDIKLEEGAEGEDKEEMEERWKRARTAVKAASKVTPRAAIRQLEQRYREQEMQIRGLRESNGGIRRALDGYLDLLRLVSAEGGQGGGEAEVKREENGGSDDEFSE